MKLDARFESFEDRLRRVRVRNGYVRAVDAARAMNLPEATYASWENGSRSPSREKLKRLADFFRVTTDFLLYGRGEGVVVLPEAPVEIPAFALQAGKLTTEAAFIADPRFVREDLRAVGSDLLLARLTDDSLAPSWPAGSRVFVDKRKTDVMDGRIYLVAVGEEYFLRRLMRVPLARDGQPRVALYPLNPGHGHFDVERDLLRVTGQAVSACVALSSR